MCAPTNIRNRYSERTRTCSGGNRGSPQPGQREQGGSHSPTRGGRPQHNSDHSSQQEMDWVSSGQSGGSYGYQYSHGNLGNTYTYPPQHGGHYPRQPHQIQSQIFRSAEASKQMVYEVYGNLIGILEELESRELTSQKCQPLPRSDIYVPDQKHKKDKDVQRIVETQLLLFQTQLKSCPQDIREEVREELKQNTRQWKAQREGVTRGKTDKYAEQLVEILDIGKSKHPDEFYQQPDIGANDIRPAFQAMMHGEHKRAELDRDFKENPQKKATPPNVRRGGDVEKGATRPGDTGPELRSHAHNSDGGSTI